MYIRRKVFSLLQDEAGEERYFSTTDITLEDAEQRIFSKKKEAYGDIDENAPDDPYYHDTIEKVGAGIGVGGATAAAGGGIVSKVNKKKAAKGLKNLELISKAEEKANRKIGAVKFFEGASKKSEAMGYDSDFFKRMNSKASKVRDEEIREGKRLLKAAQRATEKNVKKYGKNISRYVKGKAALSAGTGLAAVGGTAYVASKLSRNARHAAKKDKKDVIVQSLRESRK